MTPDITIESTIASASYFGIFVLMIANGAVSFPSSQILYIVAGYFIAQGSLSLVGVALVGALGNTIGNVILYELVRKHGRTFIERIKLFPTRELAKVEHAFKKKGAWFLFVGKLLPAIKVFPRSFCIAHVRRFIHLVTRIYFYRIFFWKIYRPLWSVCCHPRHRRARSCAPLLSLPQQQ
jgi:membrane protein YqaA with SNARE-associated domain